MARQFMEEFRNNARHLKDTFDKTVTPPAEFEKYHAKVCDYQKYVSKIADSFLLLDRQSLLINRKRALRALIESFEELRDLCKKHDAPKEYVSSLEHSISAYRQLLDIK